MFTTTRTQDALSKWTHNQFNNSLKDVDGRIKTDALFEILFLVIVSVPTLVQLLKDIDNPGEIMEYVQPYIGSVSKAKDFANDFLAKRTQIANAEVD